jgi:hypothetical protein
MHGHGSLKVDYQVVGLAGSGAAAARTTTALGWRYGGLAADLEITSNNLYVAYPGDRQIKLHPSLLFD